MSNVKLHRLNNSSAVATIHGAFDLVSAKMLKERINGVMMKHDIRNVLINLRSVTVMDNEALDSLKEFLQMCRARGGQFALVEVSQQIDMKLRSKRLDMVIPTYPNVEKAMLRI